MGAIGFEHVVESVNLSMQAAYNQAVEEAEREHGLDTYNGTISTTNGVRLVHSDPLTLTEARKIVEEYYDGKRQFGGVEKWEAAGAIPLTKGSNEREKRTKKVTLDRIEYVSYQKGNRDVIADELRILKGYELVNFVIKDQDITAKVETKATEGERETRYFIEGGGFGPARWDDGFPNQAAARAALDKRAASDDTSYEVGNREWGIYAITRRTNGSPLVRTRRVVKRAVLTVEYEMERKLVRARRDRTGWLFFGWAAC